MNQTKVIDNVRSRYKASE